MATVFESPYDLSGAVGPHLGYSDWVLVDQARIDLFAEATGDHQWIHTDPERAADGPFGATIAHGYLTLALSMATTTGLTGGLLHIFNHALDSSFKCPEMRGVIASSVGDEASVRSQ